MSTTLRGISRLWIPGFALLGLGLVGCITDDSDPGADSGGGGSSGSGGSGGASGSGTTGGASGSGATTGGSGATTGGSGGTAGSTGTVCAAPITIDSTKPNIANFDDYVAGSNLATWSFALGGDQLTGVFSGTFGYGDDMGGQPEKFEMVEGNDSTYALSISDTLAEQYGGGMGLWMSECLDATAFTGISFWVRGNSPTGDAKLTALMEETTSATPATGTSYGTCTGTDTTCVHPGYTFPVTDTWTRIQAPFSAFTGGDAAGTPVAVDGHNIWQIQFDVGLVWGPDDAGVYVPTPAEYDFAVDDMAFY